MPRGVGSCGLQQHQPGGRCCCCSRPHLADAAGIDPATAAEATPRPSAEAIDSTMLSKDAQVQPDPFVLKETVSARSGVVCNTG